MPLSSGEKARRFRDRMRSKGLRPVQIWIPDAASPAIRAEVRQQSLLVGQQPVPEEAEIMDGLEQAMAEDREWTE